MEDQSLSAGSPDPDTALHKHESGDDARVNAVFHYRNRAR
jgi:hypothetical protein